MGYIKVETNLPAESIPIGAVKELVRALKPCTYKDMSGWGRSIDFGVTIHCSGLDIESAVPSARVTCFYLPKESYFSNPEEDRGEWRRKTEETLTHALHMMLEIPPERCCFVFAKAPYGALNK